MLHAVYYMQSNCTNGKHSGNFVKIHYSDFNSKLLLTRKTSHASTSSGKVPRVLFAIVSFA